jgi:AraC family transcriptional regulator
MAVVNGGMHTTATGVKSYDCARWGDWVPVQTNMIAQPRLTCLLQRIPSGAKGKNETIVPPNHTHHVLLFWTEGAPNANYQLAGRRQRDAFSPWTGLHLPPSLSSWWEATDSTSNGLLHIHLCKQLVDEARYSAAKGAAYPPSSGHRLIDGPLTHLAKSMHAFAQESQSPSQLLWDSFAILLAFHLVRAETVAPWLRGGLAPWQVRRCTDYLNDRTSENVGLETLAELVGLSPFHFARAFRQSTGLPPHRYQLKVRIEKAKALLEMTDAPVTDIAFDVGYESSQALARLFRREVGVSPSEYRRRHRS